MPLDVLSKIQNFAEGGDVKDSIGNIASSHPELKQAFQGIANAATNGGTDINPETLAKTESIMSALAKATERANMSALGLQGAFNGMSTKRLEKAEETIGGIAEKGGRIEVDIDARRAYDKIARIAKSMNGLQSNASVRIDVQQNAPRKQPSGGAFARGGVVRQQKFATGGEVQQNFAKGGKITYHRQNTETAQRGGIFRHGSSVGDRNMIFANRGEGIITEKAMRQGARQRGMSPETYIQALNHPSTNLTNVKKGRSFKYGGTIVVSPTSVGSYAHSDAEEKYRELFNYLQSSKFHGEETNPSTRRQLQEDIDAIINTNYPHFINSGTLTVTKDQVEEIIRQAKRMEEQYDDYVKSQLGTEKHLALTSPPGTTSGKSIARGVGNTNTNIRTPVTTPGASASYTMPASLPSSAAVKSVKSAARNAKFDANAQVSSLDEEQKGTLAGKQQTRISENVAQISKVFSERSEEELKNLLGYIEHEFPGLVLLRYKGCWRR